MSYIGCYMAGMFSYGFLRTMRSQYIDQYDVFGEKLKLSLMNGIVYATPFGIPRFFNLISRIDVYVNNKDPSKYDDIYVEIPSVCKNKRVFF